MKHARLFLACMLWLSMATMATAQSTVAEGEFYLKNVGTGLYLKFGGAGNAKAAEGHAGVLVKLTKKSDNDNGYTIKTNAGYLDGALNMTGTETVWTFTAKENNSYEIASSGGVLASKNNENGLLEMQAPIDGVSKQNWILVTRDQLFNLFDMTPIIRAASFDPNDITSAWESINNNTVKIESEKTESDSENYYLHINGKASITQDLGKNMNGTFAISFDAIKKEGTASVQLQVHNNKATTIEIDQSTTWKRYKSCINVGNSAKKNVTIAIICESSSTDLSIDNFEIQYIDGGHDLDDFTNQEQARYEERAKREIADILSEIKSTNNTSGTDYFEEVTKGLTLPKNDSEFREFLNNINLIKENALNAKADPKLDEEQTEQKAETGFYPTITIKRTIKPNTWSTFVVPFDIPASFLADWEVKELSGSTYDEENDHISLTFADATDGIKAGVPYMVRVSEAVSEITVENKQLSTTLNNTTTDHVEFVGTYTSGNVPAGAFFISNNVFYQAADGTNTIKAFRAYFTTNTGTYVRSLSYRTDGETTAIDNSQLANDNEATVVAIYNLQGVRLDDMQEGVNILQMSDGRVVKVIIK